MFQNNFFYFDQKIQNCKKKTLTLLKILGKGQVRSHQWIKDANLKHFQTDEQVALVNFELDVPPGMDYLPHKVAIQVVDKGIMAEAQFLAQQRKYWPSGLL